MLPNPHPRQNSVSIRFSKETVTDRIDLLFQRMQNDDYAAFQAMFKRSYRTLCSYSNRLVVSPELAEEIVDDVFCNLWKNRKKICIETSFKSYLVISVRNRSLDCLRKVRSERKYLLERAEQVECGQSIASEKMIYDELRQHIDAAVESLPQQCRVIFRMSREQDLTYKEIARILNISIKTVDTQIGRALRSIRKTLSSRDT